MELTIIRGLPGSGKTTKARQIAARSGAAHFEADMFIDANARPCEYYQDTITRIGTRAGHEWCQSMTENALKSGLNVVVSNTFTTKAEIKPYTDLARKYGAKVTIVICRGNYGSVHSVPDEVIARMRSRWEG